MPKFNFIKYINVIYFLFILSFGIFFCKHRALFADSSPALYVFIDKHIPYFGLNRYVTIINYIFPCFISFFNIPIKIIIYSLGLNYMLLPIIVFTFLSYKKTTNKYHVIFLVSFAFFNTYSFYYSSHDYWTGFYLIFILLRILDDDLFSELLYKNFIVLLLNILIINSHSTMFILLFSIYIFLFIFKQFKMYFIVNSVTVIILYFLMNLIFTMSYDKNILTFDNNLLYSIINLPDSIMFNSLFNTILNINFIFFFTIMFFIVYLFIKNEYLLFFYFIFIFIFILLLFLFFFKDFNYSIYTEGQLKSIITIIPIIMVFVLYKYFSRKFIFLFCFIIYSFSLHNLYKGSFVVTNQYENIKMMLTKFDSNVYLTSNLDACPLECISISKQSYFINRLEFNKKFCIFSNMNNNSFVNNVNHAWIEENRNQKNVLINFPGDIKYLDADKIGVDITEMFAIYPNNNCEVMINRLKNQK